jgi:DNA-3-methyladenine glycosylase II
MFVSGTVVERALADLADRDPVVAEIRARHPGIRPLLHRDPLVAMIRAITAQQVNLRWAAVTRRRLAEAFGTVHDVGGEAVYSLEPERLARTSVPELRVLQLTNAKAASVIACARAVADGLMSVEELERLDDEAVIAHLVVLRGIGRWSAEWFLARTLKRARVVGGDLGVRKAVGRAYLDGRVPTEAETRSATAHWGAAAGVVQQLLLHDLVTAP